MVGSISIKQSFNRGRLLPVAGMLLACLLTTGCNSSDGKARVTGTVKFKGEPVEQGYITFYSPGGAAEAGKIAQGRYSLLVPPGECRIEIHANREEGFNAGMNQANIIQYLPKKYNDETTLSKEVVAGENNVFDFDLTE